MLTALDPRPDGGLSPGTGHDTDLRGLVSPGLFRAGVSRPRNLPDTLELVRRGDHLFLINHADEPVTVNGVTGTGVLDGTEYTGSATVPAEGVAVVQDTVVFIEDDDRAASRRRADMPFSVRT